MLPPGAKRWLVFRHHFKQIESPDALSRLWRGSLPWPRHFFPINIQRLNLLSNHLLRQTFFTADRERRVKDDQILAHKPTGWKNCYVFRGTIHHRPLNHRHSHTVSKISRYEANVSTSTAAVVFRQSWTFPRYCEVVFANRRKRSAVAAPIDPIQKPTRSNRYFALQILDRS